MTEKWIEEFEQQFPFWRSGQECMREPTDETKYDLLAFITKNRLELLIEICAKSESMETAKEVRHLLKEYILNGK